ncbi:MAG: NADH-quinone oxidoreductase subunit 1, partial [Pseudomonadota bacterium]
MGAKDLLIDARAQESCFHGRHIKPQILAGLTSPDGWRLKDYE